MTDQSQPGLPEDEPVIGGGTPPPPPRPELPGPAALEPPADEDDGPVIGGSGGPPIGVAAPVDPFTPADSGPSTQKPEDDPYAAGAYDDYQVGPTYIRPEERPAGREPVFYLFVVLGLALGGVFVFLLFALLGGDSGNEEEPPTLNTVQMEAFIDAPVSNDRIEVGQDRAVIGRVTSSEAIQRFELLVGGILVDQEFSIDVAGENSYRVELTARFEAVGEYDLVVRAVSVSGTEVQSGVVRIIAFETIDGTEPNELSGRVVAVASLRTGPGGSFSQAGTLEPGDIVTVVGKTRSLEWLLLERGGGLWVRRNAIDLDDSLDFVPVSDPSPTPSAVTETPDPSATASPSPSPSPDPDAPDFISTNAVLVDGGRTLRVTISNVATNPFAGPIVVGVGGVPASPAEQVVDVSLPPNGTASVDFDLDPAITEQSSVNVTVDPDNAIEESNEDNNATNFVLAPPAEGPNLSLVVEVKAEGDSMDVTITNNGDPIATNDAVLEIVVGGTTVTLQIRGGLGLADGQSTTLAALQVPQGTDPILVRLLVDGSVAASMLVANPNATTPTATPTGGTPTEAPTETPAATATA